MIKIKKTSEYTITIDEKTINALYCLANSMAGDYKKILKKGYVSFDEQTIQDLQETLADFFISLQLEVIHG